MNRRLFLAGALAVALAVAVWLLRGNHEAPETAATDSRKNLLYLRTEVGGFENVVRSYAIKSSDGSNEEREPVKAGKYVVIEWTVNTKAVLVLGSNFQLVMTQDQLNQLRERVLELKVKKKPSTAAVAVARPVTERWFRVSLEEGATGLPLLEWSYSDDSKKAVVSQVASSSRDWQNIIFPEGSAIGLTYALAHLSFDRTQVALFEGLDVDLELSSSEFDAT